MSESMQTCPSCGELVPIEYVMCVWCGYDLTAEHIRRSGIRIGKKEAIERMKKLIKNPIQTFKEIILIPDYIGGKIILYGIAFLMTINMLTVFGKLKNLDFNQNTSRLFIGTRISIPFKLLADLLLIIVQPIILFIIFSIVWKVSVRIIEWISKSFGGKGDRTKIRAVIGYSLLPVLFGWAIQFLITLITPSQTVSNVLSYSAIEQSLLYITKKSFFGILGLIFVLIGWLWSTILGIIGISKATKISYFEGIIVAGVPYLIFLSIVLQF